MAALLEPVGHEARDLRLAAGLSRPGSFGSQPPRTRRHAQACRPGARARSALLVSPEGGELGQHQHLEGQRVHRLGLPQRGGQV